MKKLIFILSLFFLVTCYFVNTEKSTEEYRKMLESNNVNDICVAAYYLGERKDTLSVKQLLSNLNDPRISHHIRHKGMSVYYCKAGALRKISGLEINIKQHQMIDSGVIIKFTNWALDNKLIDQN